MSARARWSAEWTGRVPERLQGRPRSHWASLLRCPAGPWSAVGQCWKRAGHCRSRIRRAPPYVAPGHRPDPHAAENCSGPAPARTSPDRSRSRSAGRASSSASGLLSTRPGQRSRRNCDWRWSCSGLPVHPEPPGWMEQGVSSASLCHSPAATRRLPASALPQEKQAGSGRSRARERTDPVDSCRGCGWSLLQTSACVLPKRCWSYRTAANAIRDRSPCPKSFCR